MSNKKPFIADKTSILFICLGNICRSPAADAVMRKLVDEAGMGDRFVIDSAGIGPWHVGQLPDRRMREHGWKRGLDINHIARQFNARRDFAAFDYIVVMDEGNYNALSRQAHNEEEHKKIIRMADYFSKYKGRKSVPDPYYGGEEDFELALNLIEDCCNGLINAIINKQ